MAGSVLWYHWFLVMRADLVVLRQRMPETRVAQAMDDDGTAWSTRSEGET